ncbi:MAG TPA: hypothetical protein VMK65_12800, partial [Longimicrobiales bacterium]|nr:hypothetical protein [Longimicrobiales bacterium]
MPAGLGAILLLCAFPCAALAQGKPAFPPYTPAPEPGRFLPRGGEYRDPCEVLTPAEEKAMEDVLARLEEIVRRVPALDPPRGVEARPHRTITHHRAGSCDRPLVWADLTIQLFQPTVEASGNHYSGSIAFFINPDAGVAANGNNAHASDGDGPMYLEWPRVGSVGGFPAFGAFELGSGQAVVVLLAEHDRPYWVPVSRERALGVSIAAAEKALADIGGGAPVETPYERFLREAPTRLKAREAAVAAVAASDPAGAARMRAELESSEREVSEALREQDGA